MKVDDEIIKEETKSRIEDMVTEEEPTEARMPVWPVRIFASGLYAARRLILKTPIPYKPVPIPVEPIPIRPPLPIPERKPETIEEIDAETDAALDAELSEELSIPWWYIREELRLDVDGRYPQMTASGTVKRLLSQNTHWIAKLKLSKPDEYIGKIWYKHGNTRSFPYTTVKIKVTRSWYWNQRKATIMFSGPGVVKRVRTFYFKGPHYHPVEFEYDCCQGVTPVTYIDTHDHPNHPTSITKENLTIRNVYQRAGFNARKSPHPSIVPLGLAGADHKWSDSEMHDAMQRYWSRFKNRAQWAMWVFWAALHQQGTSLGGIMFDDIGPNHRQGTAMFNDSFIKNAPAGDSDPVAWVKRMKFWTIIHEMGHSFNLAHSWQKALVYQGKGPWIPLQNDSSALSFMNYPYNYPGGQSAFFSNFEFRFIDEELLFLRHAPEQFVQPGNAAWFDHHGFEQANVSMQPNLQLQLRTNKSNATFEFLEPPMLELKLTNISQKPQFIEENLLSETDHMTIIIKKDGKTSRQFTPYARYCHDSNPIVLKPGKSEYESLFVAAGQNGWDIAEPGYYTLQVCLHMEEEDIVSNPLRIRVTPPRSYDEEYLAQDFFCDDIGRILTFNGSRVLENGINTLQEVTDRLPTNKVTAHTRIALGNALANEYKVLNLSDDVTDNLTAAHAHGGVINTEKADVETARTELNTALTENMNDSADTLGHINYKRSVDKFTDWLHDMGESTDAGNIQDNMLNTLTERNVIEPVLDDIKNTKKRYGKKK
jgi:hypothetical protein